MLRETYNVFCDGYFNKSWYMGWDVKGSEANREYSFGGKVAEGYISFDIRARDPDLSHFLFQSHDGRECVSGRAAEAHRTDMSLIFTCVDGETGEKRVREIRIRDDTEYEDLVMTGHIHNNFDTINYFLYELFLSGHLDGNWSDGWDRKDVYGMAGRQFAIVIGERKFVYTAIPKNRSLDFMTTTCRGVTLDYANNVTIKVNKTNLVFTRKPVKNEDKEKTTEFGSFRLHRSDSPVQGTALLTGTRAGSVNIVGVEPSSAATRPANYTPNVHRTAELKIALDEQPTMSRPVMNEESPSKLQKKGLFGRLFGR